MDDTNQIDHKLERLEDKIDKTLEAVASINTTLAAQHISLQEHIRRTGVAEDNIAMIRKDLKPIKTHVDRVSGILKFIGVVCVVVAAITGVLALFH